ncbi:MAG: hypothetical protein HFJ84_02595 [Clostridiales bacterium]|nr:hypothetical protein [Clostridiales bacterium]
MEEWKSLFPKDIIRNFEILNYNHAAEIISQSFSDEFQDVVQALRAFKITISEMTKSGGFPIKQTWYGKK